MGFTLIEILVAFVILGLAAGSIISIFGSGSLKVARAESERLAVLDARSVLSLVGGDVPFKDGVQHGQMPDGIQWAVSIYPYEATPIDQSEDATTAQVTEPYWITVQVTRGEKQNHYSASITSLRLKTGAP